MPRGFVLQPTYRIERNRPIVQLYGRLENGEPFLVRDTRQRPSFHIARRDAERAAGLGATVEKPAAGGSDRFTTMDGEPVVRVTLEQPADVAPLRERLSREGIVCYEADVRIAYRYLMERGIRGTVEIDGTSKKVPGLGHVFVDPELSAAEFDPEMSVLSIDIETDPRATEVLSIALDGCGASEVLLWNPPGMRCPPTAIPCPDQHALLRTFVRRIREIDPDVITGWNVVDFDLAVLARVGGGVRVPMELGRGGGMLRIRSASAPRGSSLAQIPGRVVLDGIQLLRGAFVKVERDGLNSVAQELLGRGKTITGGDRAGEILEAFHEDRAHLVEYNLNDARLVNEILDELQLIDLTCKRSRLTGMPPDRVAASIASFDFLYMSELYRRRIVAPTVAVQTSGEEQNLGGHVLEPAPGLYDRVYVFDFKSLYPSLIRTFQIDPLGLVRHPRPDEDWIVAPNGAAFRREKGILPAMLDELFPRRERAKADGDGVASQAIKILMNSFYGVLGTSACRFADPRLANAITGFGREVLLWSKARFESRGLRVLYGDTDSLFVHSGIEDPEEARDTGLRLAGEINEELREWIRERWKVESRLDLEFERLYLKLLLPAARGSAAGARKRYAGLIEEHGERRVVFTGMEVVRRDWTELARQMQRELYERLFRDRPVDTFVRDVVAEVRAGKRDAQLTYRKALRKRLDEYTASTPPHVAAARKMSGTPGRTISYIVTCAGAEPAAERVSAIDYEHYVQKQVRAVAEPVLVLLGMEFDRVVGDDQQLRLF